MLNYLKKNKKIVIGVIIFLFLLIIIVNKNKDDSGIVRDTVLRGDVSSVITLSGKVEASENVSLRFPNSGTIAGVYAKEGDFVKEGDNLLELDNRSLWADLLRAEAGLELQIAETKVSSAETDIDVENAYIDLLNNDLRAYPKNENSDYTVSAPIVSGSFLGKKEGEYNIEVYSSKSSSGASFRYSGIEGN
ncbi:MAG: HlyD family secretion protein, partial [Patescibacteria group bacterium]|nr:HlyD family secretion protein [Patescibacteria group bacterium]